MFKDIFQDLIFFLKKPSDAIYPIQSKKSKCNSLLTILIIDLLVIAIISFIINILDNFINLNLQNHQILILLELIPIWLVIVLVVFILPFFEELIFRLFLRFEYNYYIKTIIKVLSIFINVQNIENYYKSIWFSKYIYIFYFSSIAFAFVHLSNFDLNSIILITIPILILPQFVLGLFIGYLRVRFSFILGFLFHSIHNLIFIVVTLISLNSSVEKLNIQNDNFSLFIVEKEFSSSKNSTYTSTIDSIVSENIDLKSIISTLENKNLNLIEDNNALQMNKIINFQYIKKSNIELNSDSIILSNLSNIYKFKIEKKEKFQDVYNLFIQDTTKLYKYKLDENTKSSTTEVSKDSIYFSNTYLSDITNSLSRIFNMEFIIEDNSKSKFNISLPINSIKDLDSLFNNKYGIRLKTNRMNTEYIFINFY